MAGRKEREIALLDTESIFTYKRLEWVECSNSGKACVFDLRLMHDQACQARLTKDLVVLKSSNLYALQVFSLDVTENQPLNPQLFFVAGSNTSNNNVVTEELNSSAQHGPESSASDPAYPKWW